MSLKKGVKPFFRFFFDANCRDVSALDCRRPREMVVVAVWQEQEQAKYGHRIRP